MLTRRKNPVSESESLKPARRIAQSVALLACLSAFASLSISQTNPNLHTYFKNDVGLTDDQISSIRAGQAFAKNLHSRTADEIMVFGAVYINAAPESYLKLSRDYSKLRQLPGYLAIQQFSDPPRLSDLKDFSFDADDINALKNCKPGDCDVQLPESSIETLRQSINFSAPAADVQNQVDQLARKRVLERLTGYQQQGNQALGVYDDKHDPTDVAGQFKYMLGYTTAFPKYLPDFYNYLLTYPAGKPSNVENSFYWDKVKFGLKPTLRVVHVLTLRGAAPNDPAFAIAEKQLYSSHYFETALDLTFCISDEAAPKHPGFYLVKMMGSEQAGLSGVKGSIVRKVAVDRSAASLQKSLAAIKSTLEQN